MTRCLSPEEILRYLGSTAVSLELAPFEEHVDHCEVCRRSIAGVVRANRDGAPQLDGAIASGTTIGRYVLRVMQGVGAMGSVFEANDPDLDRTIAIKIVHNTDAMNDTRALREGRALARLTHPNVVAVYDVGIWSGGVFLAMELVRGTTVREWATTRRGWRDIVRVFAAAARGLHAAHGAGLVHRDIKPENLVVGDDGRVRVIDFGLAIDGTTEPRSIGGTPAYMAPEQRADPTAADARSDQYSFAVSLYETLEGKRPDPDMGFERAIPRWLRRLIKRGLSEEPEARFADMAVVARDLERGLGARRRRAIAVIAVVLSGGVVATMLRSSAVTPVCEGGERKLAGIWDPARKASIQAAFFATRLPYAMNAWTGVEKQLDRYSHDWAAMHTDACEARIRGEQSDEVLDLRMMCLSERLQELNASQELLASADKGVVKKAVQVVSGLSPIAGCADVAALSSPIRPPKDALTKSRVEDVRQQIARAKVLDDGGRSQASLTTATTALAAARATDYRPVEAEALVQLGKAQMSVRQDDAATATLENAFFVAEASRHDQVAAHSATLLLNHLVLDLPRPADAQRWSRLAEAVLLRSGGSPESRAALESGLADLFNDQSKYEEALAAHRRALAIYEKAFGDDYPDLAGSHNGMAVALENLGRYDEALAEYRRALAIREKTLGGGHPYVAEVHNGMGRVLTEQARYDEGLGELRLALQILEKIDPEHPDVARALNDIGALLRLEGKYQESLAHHQRALAMWEKALGPDHPQLAACRIDLALALGDLGRYDEAVAELRRSLSTTEKTRGPDHQEAAMAHNNLGLILGKQKKLAPALEEYRRALAIFEKTLGPDQQDTVMALINVGSAYLDLRSFDEAIRHLERALSALKGKEAVPELVGEARYTMARALNGAKRDPARAAILMRLARIDFAKVPSRSKDLAEIDAWLARSAPAVHAR